MRILRLSIYASVHIRPRPRTRETSQTPTRADDGARGRRRIGFRNASSMFDVFACVRGGDDDARRRRRRRRREKRKSHDDASEAREEFHDARETFGEPETASTALTSAQPSAGVDAGEGDALPEDDAFEELRRATEAMELETRGARSTSRTRAAAYARALRTTMRLAFRRGKGKKMDLTSFLGTPIRWCARMSTLRIALDSESPMGAEVPSRTIRFFEVLRGFRYETSALDRFLCVLFALVAEMEPPKSLRKPMNPVLGETAMHSVVFPDGDRFESVWEQVSHHPPITAHHTQGDKLVVTGQLRPRPHLVGAHVEVEIEGKVEVRSTDRDETYVTGGIPTFEWRFLPRWHSRMKPREVWTLECAKTGLRSEMEYTGGKGGYHIRGRVYDARQSEAAVACEIEGRFDDVVVAKAVESGEVLRVYDAREMRQSRGKIIKHTDVRDDRDTEVVWGECFNAMTAHNWEEARAAKRRVEEAERAARRVRRANGETWVPRYFTFDAEYGSWRRNPFVRVVLH